MTCLFSRKVKEVRRFGRREDPDFAGAEKEALQLALQQGEEGVAALDAKSQLELFS